MHKNSGYIFAEAGKLSNSLHKRIKYSFQIYNQINWYTGTVVFLMIKLGLHALLLIILFLKVIHY